MTCHWCGSDQIEETKDVVYWELPDGTRAIQITDVPSIRCHDCGMLYQEETTIKEIENQLFLINTKLIGKTITYHELMEMPRLLKRNYFDFSS